MAKSKDAVKPDFYRHFQSLRNKEIASKAGVSQDELDYFHMSKTRGWTLFNNLKKRLIQELDELNDNAIASGASFEDIGRNTIVINQTKGIIKRLFNKVEDAREACEEKQK